MTPSGILDNGWLAVAGEAITAVGQGALPAATVSDDYTDAFILPGAIDGQTHAGSQMGFPGLAPTTQAAVIGGVTTIVDMPYDEPDPTTTAAVLRAKIDAIHQHAVCDVALYGTVPTEPDAGDVAALIAGGVAAFKISSFEAHPTRFPRIDNGATLDLIAMLEKTGLPLGLHNEDQDIVRRTTRRFIAEGKTGPEWHSDSRPEVAELAATATFLQLGQGLETHLHIVHISTPEGFDLVRRARDRGQTATAEMCVHYLHFNAATDMRRIGPRLKVNPPIRPGRKDELWAVLERGDAAFVSSDHSAWPLSRKDVASIFDAAAGMPGLEALLPVFVTDAAARWGLDAAVRKAAEYLAERPAQFFGLSRKGRLTPGLDADFVVLEPKNSIYDSRNNPDGPGWSAYDGETFAVKPVATFVRGRRVWDGTRVVAEPGSGRFVARTPA